MSGTTPPFRRYDRRSRTSASDQNRLRATVERLDRPDADPNGGVRISRTGGGMLYEDAEAVKDTFLIKITGGVSSPYTSWTEVTDDGAGGFTPPGNAYAGNGVSIAREINGTSVAVNTVCRAWLASDNVSVDFVAPGQGNSISNTTLIYTNDTINFAGDTINYTSDTTVNYTGTAGHLVIVTFGAFSSLVISGTVTDYATLTIGPYVNFNLTVSPCWTRLARQITTSTVNDWTLDPAPWWVIDYNPGGGTCILYGIVAPTCNRDIWITNTGTDTGTNNTILQFRHEDVTETTAARRFLTPDGQSYDLKPQQTAFLRYDMVTARWRLFVVPAGLESPLTTKGDVWVYSTTDTRLPVGTNGQILSADSSQATGLKWINNAIGTVTSITAGTGLTGGTITTTGTIALSVPVSTTNGGTGLDTSGVTDGQLLIGQTSDHTWGRASLTAGSGISVSSGGHSVTVSTSGFSGTVQLAKLTTGGTIGSLTVSNGVITAYTAPT